MLTAMPVHREDSKAGGGLAPDPDDALCQLAGPWSTPHSPFPATERCSPWPPVASPLPEL